MTPEIMFENVEQPRSSPGVLEEISSPWLALIFSYSYSSFLLSRFISTSPRANLD